MNRRTQLLDYCTLYYVDGAKSLEKQREAFKMLTKHFMNTIEYELYVVYDYYGKKELKWDGIEKDDIINAGVIGLARGLEMFDFTEEFFSPKAFTHYMHLMIKRNIRDYIQSVNEKTAYYSTYLIRMKMRGYPVLSIAYP